jgi:hypothetical protein
MNTRWIVTGGFAMLCISLGASADTVSLDVSNNDSFPLAGGGGGNSASVDGTTYQLFGDDFFNSISLSTDYTSNVTTLGTNANLGQTRFGNVASSGWMNISLTDGNSNDFLYDAFFNSGSGSSALARYEMAAYLISQYNLVPGYTVTNNEIQQAIWTLFDPGTSGGVTNPSGLNPAGYLEQVANWYVIMSSNPTALNAFLSNYEVLSDPTMSFSNGVGIGGFGEQLIDPPSATPEPRGGVWVLLGALMTGLLFFRRTSVAFSNARARN